MNTIIIKSLLVIFLASNLFSAKAADDSIIFMSYNIRVAVDTGVNAWDVRKTKVASMIKFHHADILGVQEALLTQLNDLTMLLPAYKWVGAGRDDGKDKGEFSSIFYKEDKFELVKEATFWLSETPDVPSKGWDAALPRVMTWAEFKDKESGGNFFVFNTHFDHIGETARQKSSELILKKVKEIAGDNPVIVMGDFNSRPESKSYQILTDKSNPLSLYDSQYKSKNGHYGSDVSFNGFGTTYETGNTIDFIFIKNSVEVLQHGIIGEKFYGNYPSDHMPVLAEIIVK